MSGPNATEEEYRGKPMIRINDYCGWRHLSLVGQRAIDSMILQCLHYEGMKTLKLHLARRQIFNSLKVKQMY